MENKTDWEEEISLFDLINVLLKRKWLIVGITLVVMVVAFLAWKLVPQTYRAEFAVSFTESSFPKEFKGQVAITYYGKEEPVYIPYSFSLSSEDQELPGRTLDSFAKKQKLAGLAKEAGFEALFERAGGTLSVNITPQESDANQTINEEPGETEQGPVFPEKKEFLVALSARDEELCRKIAQTLTSKIREEVLSALQTQHKTKLTFHQQLLETSDKNYRIARDKLIAFLEEKNPLALDARLQNIEQSLKALRESKYALLVQQNAFPISLPFSAEALRELLYIPLEEIFTLEKEAKQRLGEKILEVEKEITALEQEKKVLEQERLKRSELIDAYNLLLRDYTFWKEVKSSLLFSRPSLAEDGTYPFDGKVEVAEIEYSGSGRDLKLHLAVGLVAGLFLGVFVAFFAEFWEKAKMQRG